ncbi:MAG: hypothetical protein Q8M29_02085 [Bacteroidota bacterium]|nr:hypothetical protein [Bacteroidota bacterium]
MTKIKTTILIVCLISCTFRGFTQCADKYINNRFGVEICNNSNWEIKEQLPYILVKSNGINVSIYAERYSGDLTAKEIWQTSYEQEKKENSDLELKNQETIKIDSIQAYLGITYLFPINTDAKMRKETHNISVIFLFNGLKYVINNNCYSNDCALNEKMVRDIISNLTLIKEGPIVLTNEEKKQITVLGNNLFNSFKKAEINSFQKLLINKKNMNEGIELNMKDKEMKVRFAKIINENWEEAFSLFVTKSEESFKALSEDGNKLKIKWSKIEFISFTYEPHSGIPDMKSVSGIMTFKFSEKNYAIKIKDIILLKDGWYIVELKDKQLRQN